MFIPELENLKDKIVGIRRSPRRIANIINKILYKTYGVEVKAAVSSKLKPGDMTITAYFDHHDWNEFDNIEIFIVYSSKYKRRIKISEKSWRELSFKIYQAHQHELKHREQFKKRDGFDPWSKRRDEKGWYFIDPDEIDTHAHDIALELLFFGYNVDEALQELKYYPKINLKESITLFAYMIYFEYDTANPYIKQLTKKTAKYLEEKRSTFVCSSLSA